jgi:hypothetical protein
MVDGMAHGPAAKVLRQRAAVQGFRLTKANSRGWRMTRDLDGALVADGWTAAEIEGFLGRPEEHGPRPGATAEVSIDTWTYAIQPNLSSTTGATLREAARRRGSGSAAGH